jgi:hypothetical protein
MALGAVGAEGWAEAVAGAKESLGYPDPRIDRTVAGVLGALRVEHRETCEADLAALSSGLGFEVFLDQWWTQAVVGGADGEEAREAALEFADLAVSLRIRACGLSALDMGEVERLAGPRMPADAR